MKKDSPMIASRFCSEHENAQRINQRRKYEKEVLDELEWGSNITEYDEFEDEVNRYNTRLDRSRILQTDEDNLNGYE